MVANKSSENVTNFKHFVTASINQNCMHEEIKQKINFEECLLQFRLISKNTKNKIYSVFKF